MVGVFARVGQLLCCRSLDSWTTFCSKYSPSSCMRRIQTIQTRSDSFSCKKSCFLILYTKGQWFKPNWTKTNHNSKQSKNYTRFTLPLLASRYSTNNVAGVEGIFFICIKNLQVFFLSKCGDLEIAN